ncbi:MAG TPA: cytochrome c biogenesis protein CcsA, partial [Tepidiformaceae bacterium]|nr:cytochrome c biogenesis protein CcsA [Tepidiformaceae bacterium]
MEDLSIYLFWTGLLMAAVAGALYMGYVASASVALRRFSAETGAGTVTVTQAPAGPNPGIGRLATTFTAFTLLALGGAIVARWVAVGHTPLSNMYEFTVAFSFATVVAYLAFETATGMRRMGVVALPIVIAMLGITSLFPSDIVPLIPALQNGRLLTIHVSMMMASYAVLTVAFSGALVYLLQGGEGGRRFAALPGADAAGDLAHKAVMVGFPMLGLGIALGAWWANDAWGRYWGWDPKETSALVTWLSL